MSTVVWQHRIATNPPFVKNQCWEAQQSEICLDLFLLVNANHVSSLLISLLDKTQNGHGNRTEFKRGVPTHGRRGLLRGVGRMRLAGQNEASSLRVSSVRLRPWTRASLRAMVPETHGMTPCSNVVTLAASTALWFNPIRYPTGRERWAGTGGLISDWI